jgi:hypothetical protein
VQLDRVGRDAGLAVVEVEESDPGHACSRADAQRRRAAAICACRTGSARLSQVGAGDSVIIVLRPSLTTRWKSSSDSCRISTTLAVTAGRDLRPRGGAEGRAAYLDLVDLDAEVRQSALGRLDQKRSMTPW